MKMRFSVTAYGQDTLGNPTGYEVKDSETASVVKRFVGDLHTLHGPGSLAEAKAKAYDLAACLDASSKTEMSQVIVRALYNLPGLPSPNHPEVERRTRKGKVKQLTRQHSQAVKAILSALA